MDQQLIQAAAQSFCIVPEIYQQVFKQSGAEFPDELVAQIKSQPEQAMEMLQSDEKLLNSVVQVYGQYKDQIDKAVSQTKQQTGLFKKGGKLEQLLIKAQQGRKIIKPGTEYFKVFAGKPNFWDSLFRIPRNELPDTPGIKKRSIEIVVDPETGEQNYQLDEVVDGTSATTDFEIKQPGDTVVHQTIPTRDSYVKRAYLPNDDRYRTVVDRLLDTGAVDFVNRNFPTTRKK